MGGARPRGRRSYDERHPDDAAEGDLLYGRERDAGKAGNLERNFGEEKSYSAVVIWLYFVKLKDEIYQISF